MSHVDEWDERIETETSRAALQKLESELEGHMAAGDKGSAARCLHAMADVYGNNLYEIQKQNELLVKSLDLYKEMDDKDGMIRLYRELMHCSNLLDVDATFQEMCQIYKERNDTEKLIDTLQEWAGTYKNMRQDDSEKKVLLELVKVHEDNQMHDELFWIYRHISELTEDLDENIRYLDRIPKLKVLNDKFVWSDPDFDIARAYESEGMYLHAIDKCREIIIRYKEQPLKSSDGDTDVPSGPYIAFAHLFIGRINYKMGRTKESIEHFNKALNLYGDELPTWTHQCPNESPYIYNMLGMIAKESGDLEQAVQHFRSGLSFHAPDTLSDAYRSSELHNELKSNLADAIELRNWRDKYSREVDA